LIEDMMRGLVASEEEGEKVRFGLRDTGAPAQESKQQVLMTTALNHDEVGARAAR